MKLFKKAAALFFCLALALSVMAISASAQDGTPMFTLSLQQVTEFANNDSVPGLEVHKDAAMGHTVIYAMKLRSDEANQKVSSFTFKIGGLGSAMATVKFFPGATSTTTASEATTQDAVISGTSSNIYTFSSFSTATNDFNLETASTDVIIGTISFDVSGVAMNTTVTPTLSDITVATRVNDVYDGASYTVDAPAVDTFQVDPIYTMTLVRYKKADTTGVKEVDTATAPQVLYYDFDHNFYSDNAGTTTYSAGLEAATALAGYTYNGWKITTTGGTWEAIGATVNPMSTVTSDKVGNVTLTADYTAKQYKFSFKYNDGDNDVDVSGTYTVESVETTSKNTTPGDGLASLVTTDPTWSGYIFRGWKVEQDSTGDDTSSYNSSLWTAYTATDYDATNTVENAKLVATSAYIGHDAYGDVILTAIWDEAGVFTKANYGYANSSDNLVLYAVPNDNYDSSDTYQYTYTPSGGTATQANMFIIPNTRYNSLFTDLDAQKTYVIYAYIADSDTAVKGNVTVSKDGNGTTNNVTIVYDGDVNRAGDSKINAADYGNVDSILAANGGTLAASALTATQIRARLEADIVHNNDTFTYNGTNSTVADEAANYASIWDMKKIISMLN